MLRRAAAGLVGLVVLVALGLLVYLRDLDGKVRATLGEQSAELGARIGRRITVGDVHVAVGLAPEIVVHDVEVGPAEGAQGELAVPVLRISAVRLAVALGPLIRSGGSVIEVTRFHVEGPEANLVQSAEGLSTDDIRARLAAAPVRPAPAITPQLALRSLAITGGKIRVHALGGETATDLTVAQITLTGHDLTLIAPSRLSLAAAVLSPTPNVSAELDLAPAAAGPGLVVRRAEIHVAAIHPGAAARWARATAGLEDAELDAALVVEPTTTADTGTPAATSISIKGKVTVVRARIAGGPPTAVSLGVEASLDPAAGALAVPSFELTIGPVTAHGSATVRDLDGTPSVDALSLDASGDAAALRDLLPPWLRRGGVDVRGPITLALRGGGGADEVHGHVEVTAGEVRALGVDRAGRVSEGQPAHLTVVATLAISRSAASLRVADVAVHLGEIVVRGDAELRGVAGHEEGAPTPMLEALSLEATAPGEALLETMPPALRPPGLTLHGPLVARVSARGVPADLRGKLAVELGGAAVRARGFTKPAGVPLSLTVEGGVAHRDGGDPHLPASAEIDRAELRLGTAALAARGTVHGAEQLDLTFEPLGGSAVDLAEVLQLFPDAAARVGAGTGINGRLAASGRVRRSGGKTTLDLTTTLREAGLHRALAGISGTVDVTAHLEASASTASVHADVDLTRAIVDVVPVIAKRAGRPAHLAFTVSRDGDHVSVSDARVTLPGLTIDGLTAEQGAARVHVVVGGATVGLMPLVDMVPLLQGRLPPSLAGATLHFGLELDGAPDALGAASLRIPSFDIAGGLGHLAGSAQMQGLPPQALHFDVSRGDLDLSSFESPAGGGDVLAGVPAVRFDGRVHLDSATAGGQTARGLDADVSFEHGRLAIAALRLGALGGTIAVENSYLDVAGVPELELHARVEGIDLARFAGPRAEELRGHATGAIDLHGAGADRATLVRSLHGGARLEVSDLHVRAVFPRPKITVVNPHLGELMRKAAEKHAGEARTLDLRQVSADFDVAAGKATTRSPLVLRSDDFTVRFTGTIGEGTGLALDGRVEIPAHAIATASGRRLIPLGPIPLKLRLYDDGGGRKLELLELEETAAAFRGSLWNAVGSAKEGAPAPSP